MRTLIALGLCLSLAAPLSASAATEGTYARQICGTLREHRPATANATGALVIGTRSYVIESGVVAGNGGVTVAVGRDLCVQASQGRTSGQLLRYLFYPLVDAGRSCGNAMTSTVDTVTLSADFGELTLRRGAAIPAGQGSERICYATQIDRQSGDLVATGILAVRDIDRERISHCGTVQEYRPATTSGSGRIRIGSQEFRIAAGVAYTGDPAGSRTDRTTVGSAMCLRATLGTAGEVVEYLTSEMPASTGGAATAYLPATGGHPGSARLSYGSRFDLVIPEAVHNMGDIARGSFCYSVGVHASGDISATSIIPCDPGRAAGPATSPAAVASPAVTLAPTAAASPTAAESPTATVTAQPTASAGPAAAAVSASPSPAARAVAAGPDPLLVVGALSLAALAIVATYLARRR